MSRFVSGDDLVRRDDQEKGASRETSAAANPEVGSHPRGDDLVGDGRLRPEGLCGRTGGHQHRAARVGVGVHQRVRRPNSRRAIFSGIHSEIGRAATSAVVQGRAAAAADCRNGPIIGLERCTGRAEPSVCCGPSCHSSSAKRSQTS